MSETTISVAEVEALGAKLDGLTDQLDEQERAILLAVFQVAGEHIAGDVDVEGFAMGSQSLLLNQRGTMPSLSSGFGQSFQGLGGVKPGGMNQWDVDINIMG